MSPAIASTIASPARTARSPSSYAGSVVVGYGGGKEVDVFGDAPNIAARVQAAAAPDSVFITAAVHQLVSGLFVVEDRGAQQLKGIAQPVQLYRVIQPTVMRRRIHGAAVRSLTPFIGRASEIQLLLNRWERAREGEGQLALVVGEAGIGKSRLLEEFRARIKDEPHLWFECGAEQTSASTPQSPRRSRKCSPATLRMREIPRLQSRHGRKLVTSRMPDGRSRRPNRLTGRRWHCWLPCPTRHGATPVSWLFGTHWLEY